MYGVGCVVHRLGAGVFRIQRSLIYFVSSWSAGLNRPVAAMRRNVMSLYYLRRRESVFRRGKTKRFDEPSQAIAGQDDIPRLFSRSPRVFAEAAELEKAAHRRPRHLRRFSTARTRSLSFLARALGRVMPAERRSKRVLRRRSLPRDARNWPAWAASCWRMRVSAGPVSGAGRDSSKLISSDLIEEGLEAALFAEGRAELAGLGGVLLANEGFGRAGFGCGEGLEQADKFAVIGEDKSQVGLVAEEGVFFAVAEAVHVFGNQAPEFVCGGVEFHRCFSGPLADWGYTQRFFRKVIHNCPYQTRAESGRQSAIHTDWQMPCLSCRTAISLALDPVHGA